MDVAQQVGLDMKDETTILAWQMEECDEFYFCSSVIYVAMAQHQVLDSLAALLRNASMRTPFDQIDICIAGMTDLCAPEFDDRFDARLPVREAAKHLVSAGSKQAICIFYLDHLLRGHEMRAVEDHALDGACLLNKCSYENTSMLWRAYIRPLGSAHCPTPATQKQRSPRDARE